VVAQAQVEGHQGQGEEEFRGDEPISEVHDPKDDEATLGDPDRAAQHGRKPAPPGKIYCR